MKITLELENDEEKATAKRFLDDDTTPQVIVITEARQAFRVFLSLRQIVRQVVNMTKRGVA